MNRPKDRCVIFINVPFQFLMNGCWRKGTDGLDMYSPVTSAFFQYKSEDDLSLLSNSFVGVRIVVLIKDSTKFIQKLLLVTSKTLLIVAGQVDSEFNRNSANDRRTTLFLAMSAEDQRIININVFPKDKISHQYVLPSDQEAKKFKISLGLMVNMNGGSDAYGGFDDTQTNAQLDKQSNIDAQCFE